LEFWVGVQQGAYLQLDDVVALDRVLPDGEIVRVYGVVSQVRARHDGLRFDSDVFLVADGVLPAEVSEAAQVQATRFDPEIFVPPCPGDVVRRATGDERASALGFDEVTRQLPAGLSRDGEPVYLDVDFLDGTKGAHVNISGVSGVATKTSYATFVLYGLFHSGVLGAEAINTKALVFNVKGEDLLFLDHPNLGLAPEQAARYRALGLPAEPFRSVGVWAPPRRDGTGDGIAAPDVASRSLGVRSVTAELQKSARDNGDPVNGTVSFDGRVVRHFDDLVDVISDRVLTEDGELGPWAGRAITGGTVNAFLRRLHGATRHIRHLVRADVARPDQHSV